MLRRDRDNERFTPILSIEQAHTRSSSPITGLEMMTDYFTHPLALCESKAVGAGTRIWAFAHVLPGARIGRNCNICDHVFIENDVSIGDDVTVKCGVQLWDGVTIGNRAFIGPNVTFTNDKFPRSKQYPESFLATVVEDGASIGANATILPGVRIGRDAMVGAGSVVTKDVPPNVTVVGNPAKPIDRGSQNSDAVKSLVGGWQLWTSPDVVQLAGEPVSPGLEVSLPYSAKHMQILHKLPKHAEAGYAELQSAQVLIALQGAIAITLDDGSAQTEVTLSDPASVLQVAPKTWTRLRASTPEIVLLAIRSHPHNEADLVFTREEFLRLVSSASVRD